jgi:hypothetical protein
MNLNSVYLFIFPLAMTITQLHNMKLVHILNNQLNRVYVFIFTPAKIIIQLHNMKLMHVSNNRLNSVYLLLYPCQNNNTAA